MSRVSTAATRLKRACGFAMTVTALLAGTFASPASAAETRENGGDVHISQTGFSGGGYQELYFYTLDSSYCVEVHWTKRYSSGITVSPMKIVKARTVHYLDAGWFNANSWAFVTPGYYWERPDLGSLC